MKDMEPKTTIFCNEARFLEVILEHQPRLKTHKCPGGKMHLGNGGSEFMGVVNQWLVQLDDLDTRGIPCPTLPG